MASANTKDLKSFKKLIETRDNKARLAVANDLISFLSDPMCNMHCNDISSMIDSLLPWVNSNHFKVAQAGLDILCQMCNRLGSDFKAFLPSVLLTVIDRLGDNKDAIRERCQLFIAMMIEKEAVLPHQVLDKMVPCFTHKNINVRNEALNCLSSCIDGYGSQGIQVSKFVPLVVKLLLDPSMSVKDNAVKCLVTMYRHVGDKLRVDLVRGKMSGSIPPQKLQQLLQKFDELKAAYDLAPTAVILDHGFHTGDEMGEIDEPNRQDVSSLVSRSKIRRAVRPCAGPSSCNTGLSSQRWPASQSTARSTTTSTAAGSVDEEYFIRAFNENVDVQIFSAREVEDHMVRIRETVGNATIDWNKRVDALKKIRGLVAAGAANFDEFYSQLRMMKPSFENAVRDLRSQVVREACITIAFLSSNLENRFDYIAECILQHVIALLMNAAKVMSSSSLVCLRFIVQHTHSLRLIPIIINHLNSKSKEIRRAMCELMDLILYTWPEHLIEKFSPSLEEGIRKGIADADSEARAYARKAYWAFAKHFEAQAATMMKNFVVSHQRALLSDPAANSKITISGSTSSLIVQLRSTTPRPDHQGVSDGGSTTMPCRGPTPSPSLRSNSAIDLQAAQQAKARAQYAALALQKVGSGASLPRPRKILPEGGPGSLGAGQERVGRTRNRVSGVSQSQPSSRSGSPSCRQNLYGHSLSSSSGSQYSNIDGPSSLTLGRPSRSIETSDISTPRSTGASRETSPNRNTSLHAFGNKMRSRGIIELSPVQPSKARPVMTQKILQQSLEVVESALAEALSLEPSDYMEGGVTDILSQKSSCHQFDDFSDDSEISSLCSERSFDSFRRPSDFYSWSGSQQRLYKDVWEPTAKDIIEIIANCESTRWIDRKEGLVGLQAYLQAGNLLQPPELKRVTDNFTNMFMDLHTKVFSLFLDTLNDLIIAHKTDLNFWLYVLLTRLLNKLGGELLGSIQNKIHKLLDVIRDSFPSDVQISTVLRFLCDAMQTTNARVETAACNYITKLAAVTDPGYAILPPSPDQVKDTATAALTKMIGWTMGDYIKQGSELRRAAQEAIIALYNINKPQVTLRFSLLTKEYQEAAANLIQGRVWRSSASSSMGIGDTGCFPPISSGSPPPTATPAITSTLPPTPPSKYPSHIDAENLNPEEVYQSLHRTHAEIKNYSYEPGGEKIDREETSQDSGISQLSSGGDVQSLTQHMEDKSISRNCPSSTGRVLTVRDCNGIDTTDNVNQGEGFNIEGQTIAGNIDESEAMRKVIESLNGLVEGDDSNSQNCFLSDHEKKIALTQLKRLIQGSSCVVIMDHFKSILRVLLTQLGSNEPTVRSLVLELLTEMVKKRALADSFNNYVELLVLKVLQVFKDGTNDLQRNAEICAANIASLLAPEPVIRVLVPLITTEAYPVNLGAIKTLTKLVETRGRDPVQSYLSDLMPGLIEAYDNEESSVRKSAVFCVVALHTSVGEEQLRPYLSSLNDSKLKLLHLYIKRKKQGSSVPTSPKHQPNSSS